MKGYRRKKEVVSLRLEVSSLWMMDYYESMLYICDYDILFLLISGLKVGGAIVGLFFWLAIKTVVVSTMNGKIRLSDSI